MRKTLYAVSFVAIALTLTMNILSARRPDWLVTRTSIFHSKVTIHYGLTQRCESQIVDLPGGGIAYKEFSCRPFPQREEDGCDNDHRGFCLAWKAAAVVDYFGVACAALAMLVILLGTGSHSRRNRVWQSVAWLLAFHALFQIGAFTIITRLYAVVSFPTFDRARPATAYILNGVSWILSTITLTFLIISGLCANAGHKWAAGQRSYQPLLG